MALALLIVAPALAASVRELIAQGNAHYAAGRYGEALAAYQQAAGVAGPSAGAELLHNQAAAQFKLGNFAEARELWVRALALKDAAFEAKARYNLGNCDYADALRALESSKPDAVPELLARAVQQYRDAIRLDPALADARANLELAGQLRKKLEEQATTQPQSQPGSQPSGQKQPQSTQPADQPQKGDSGEQDQTEPSPSTQTEPGSEQPPPPSTQPDAPQPQTQPSPPGTQPSDSPAESQPTEPPPGDQAEEPPADQPHALIRMTPEQAERLLQKIRDAEKARRRALREREAARQKPVDRDW